MAKNITMNINETLELDYLVEQITDDEIKIADEPSSGATSLNYIAMQKGVFNPLETGTYELNINGKTVKIEVIDIPDTAIHRWKLGEGSGSTVSDSIGNQDGSINGASWVTNGWIGDSALNGDGSDDYVDIGGVSGWIDRIDDTWAAAFTIKTTDTGGRLLDNSYLDNTNNEHWVILSIESDGVLRFNVEDWSGNRSVVESTTSINDGIKHRCVINGTSNNASDWDWHIDNGNSENDVKNSGTISDTRNEPGDGLKLFRRSNQSSDYFNGTLDDIILFNESLSDTEIKDDYNRQPWS